MNIKYLTIILSSLLILGFAGLNNKKIDPENDKSKRLEIFSQDESIEYEKGWSYRPPHASNTNIWPTSDSAQIISSPENFKINNLNNKRILSLNAQSNKLDEVIPVPVIKDNILYFKNNNSLIFSYNLETGKNLWSQYASEEKKKGHLIGGGLFLHNDILYASFGSNEVLALNANTGEEIWRTKLSSVIRTTPIYAYNKIFVRSLDNKFFVLNADNGNLIHVADTGIEALVRASKAAVVFSTHGSIIVPSTSGQLNCLNPNTGDSIWSENISFYNNPLKNMIMNDISMTPVIRGHLVYTASQTGNLAALNLETGNIIWNNSLSGVESVWMAGNGLFAIDDSNNLWHLNALNGLARWKSNLKGLLGKSEKDQGQFFGPVMADGKLLISSSFGKLLEVSPQDGSLVATYEIPKEKSSVPIVINEKLFLLSTSGKLTIFNSK